MFIPAFTMFQIATPYYLLGALSIVVLAVYVILQHRTICRHRQEIENQNEKYLLKFISNSSNNELLELIYKFGIKLNFQNTNPVYQIIDELNFAAYQKN